MPSIVKIDPRRRIVLSTFYGDVTDEQLMVHRSAIAADRFFDPGFAEIVDFSGASMPLFSQQALSKLAKSKSLFDPSVPHVIIAPHDTSFAMALGYQQLAKDSRANLFVVRSLAEAHDLLKQHGYSGEP